MLTKPFDNNKSSATVNLVNEQLSQLNIDITENENMDKHLGKHGLHLTNHGQVRLATNLISYVKKLWRFDCNRESTLHNLSKNPSNDSYTKGSVRTSGNNMDLDIDDPLYLGVNNLFNPIVEYLTLYFAMS